MNLVVVLEFVDLVLLVLLLFASSIKLLRSVRAAVLPICCSELELSALLCDLLAKRDGEVDDLLLRRLRRLLHLLLLVCRHITGSSSRAAAYAADSRRYLHS
ncbi:hypothetical protein T492DRAFT_980867 [Pavlovales sp. CCMP2436]|nr:hypothetical protein T492DRAFT_980867 [Pavlovales sp. CCMP2436]